MQRQYATILPKKSLKKGSDVDSEQETHDHKKRRIGVTVACDRCRERKIRCDGKRPVCSNCQGKAGNCTYRNNGQVSTESSKLILEIFRHLNQLPSQESTRFIYDMKNEQNAWKIVVALRGQRAGLLPMPEGSPKATQANMAGNSSSPQNQLEFQVQNPIAYPPISAPGTSALATAHLDEPLRQSTSPPSSLATEDDLANVLPFNIMSPNTDTSDQSAQYAVEPPRLCDERLNQLDITRWTDVDITSDLAAKCISLYLETDHPLLGQFDPELFVAQLISGEEKYCSSLLVNALLYWACQMYSAVDDRASELVPHFCSKAEALWETERKNQVDSITNIAAAEFLSLGYLGHGRDHSVIQYLTEAANMGARMGLFRVAGQTATVNTDAQDLSADAQSSHQYAAWGVFNWLILMSLFYHQPGTICPLAPPTLALPSKKVPAYMGHTLPHLCIFWTIIREVNSMYQAEDGSESWGASAPLVFAEFKFRELLAWSNNLPPDLLSDARNPHHVHVMHLWLHAAIFDVFRPFMSDSDSANTTLRTFANGNTTPKTVVEASTSRLKTLIVSYRLNYAASSNSTILWHTALTYVANALLQYTEDDDWYSYLLLCLYGYQRLSQSWRVARAISKGLLSMMLRKSNIPAFNARKLLSDLETGVSKGDDGQIHAPFALDLGGGRESSESTTVERLADQLEENFMLRELTNIFDQGLN